MVCPNCGNDCTNAKFCPECGQMLQTAEKEAPEETSASKIPLGTYKGILSSLELGKTGLTVSKTFVVKKTTFIPYEKLTKVWLSRQYKTCNGDYLLFRWEGNDQLPIPAQKDMCLDKTAYCSANSTFLYHMFAMLKHLAPDATFHIENNFADTYQLEDLARDFNLSAYFKKYNPHREPATAKLRKDFGIKWKKATQYIDRYFDWQFEGLYTIDPKKAFRDLDSAIKMLPYAAGAACGYPIKGFYEENAKSEGRDSHRQPVRDRRTVICPRCGSPDIKERASNGTGVGLFHYRTPVVNLIASIIRFAVIMKKSMEPKKASYICNSCKLIWETEIEK